MVKAKVVQRKSCRAVGQLNHLGGMLKATDESNGLVLWFVEIVVINKVVAQLGPMAMVHREAVVVSQIDKARSR